MMRRRAIRRRDLSAKDQKRLDGARRLEFKAHMVQHGVAAAITQGLNDPEEAALCAEELMRSRELMKQGQEIRDTVFKRKR